MRIRLRNPSKLIAGLFEIGGLQVMATKTCFAVFVITILLMGASALAVPAPGQEPKGVVTFYKDVLPILQKNCQSCHRPGQIGPFSMLDYKEARPWTKAIKAAVMSRTMPPWLADPKYGHFNNDRSLKHAEIDTLAAWADSGAAEGDSKDAPAPVQWLAGGWQIKPDVTEIGRASWRERVYVLV